MYKVEFLLKEFISPVYMEFSCFSDFMNFQYVLSKNTSLLHFKSYYTADLSVSDKD